MIYVDHRDGSTHDTKTETFDALRGLIWHLDKFGVLWMRANGGPEAVVKLVRAIRAEAFKRREKINGAMMSRMNRLDPPHCRCGRPGTRIIGSETFCMRCGPSDAAKARWKYRSEQLEERGRGMEPLVRDRENDLKRADSLNRWHQGKRHRNRNHFR